MCLPRAYVTLSRALSDIGEERDSGESGRAAMCFFLPCVCVSKTNQNPIQLVDEAIFFFFFWQVAATGNWQLATGNE